MHTQTVRDAIVAAAGTATPVEGVNAGDSGIRWLCFSFTFSAASGSGSRPPGGRCGDDRMLNLGDGVGWNTNESVYLYVDRSRRESRCNLYSMTVFSSMPSSVFTRSLRNTQGKTRVADCSGDGAHEERGFGERLVEGLVGWMDVDGWM
jgi:hypothetical protein